MLYTKQIFYNTQNWVLSLFVSTFQNGESPLHAAAFSGSLAVCKQLIASGADPYLKNQDSFTPREVAQRNKHNVVHEYLRSIEERINNNNNNKA